MSHRRRRYGGDRGISLGEESSIVSSSAIDNGGIGMYATTGCRIQGSSVSNNGDVGVVASGSGCLVVDNQAVDNTSHGLDVGGYGSHVRGNSSRSNGGNGIRMHTSVAYSDNVVSDHSLNVQNGVDAGGNVCDGVLGGC